MGNCYIATGILSDSYDGLDVEIDGEFVHLHGDELGLFRLE